MVTKYPYKYDNNNNNNYKVNSYAHSAVLVKYERICIGSGAQSTP